MIRGPVTKGGGVGTAQVIAKIKATSTSITNGGSYSGRNRNLTLYPVCEVPQRCLKKNYHILLLKFAVLWGIVDAAYNSYKLV